MSATIHRSQPAVWNVIKKTIPLTQIVNVVSILAAYGFYQLAFKASIVPVRIAVAVMVISIVGPCLIAAADGGRSRLRSLGLANLILVGVLYFFFGGVCFFFYFLFAPMPAVAHSAGIALGLALTCYWMAFTARDVSRALALSDFVEKAFEDTGSALHYRLHNIAMLEPRLSSRNASGKLHQFLVLLVAPVCLVIARIITPVLGAHGTLLLIAMIMFPVSQWLAGLAMRQYVVMIRLPAMLERKNGKPVVVIDDDRA